MLLTFVNNNCNDPCISVELKQLINFDNLGNVELSKSCGIFSIQNCKIQAILERKINKTIQNKEKN